MAKENKFKNGPRTFAKGCTHASVSETIIVEIIAFDTEENSSIDAVISGTGTIFLHVVILPAFPNFGETNAEVPTMKNDIQINRNVATKIIIL